MRKEKKERIEEMIRRKEKIPSKLVRIDPEAHTEMKEHCKETKQNMSDFATIAVLEKILSESD